MFKSLRLRLTDDELASLALRFASSWSVVLPTIPLLDEESLQTAAARGSRSLYARELVDDSGRPRDQLDSVMRALASPVRLVFNFVDADEVWVPSGLTFYLYGGSIEELAISHILSAGGVHYFRWDLDGDGWQVLFDLLSEIYSTGFTAEGRSAGVTGGQVSIWHNETIRLVTVAENVVTTSADGGKHLRTISAAISYLKGAGGS